MGYALMWVESLIAAVLCVAAGVAFCAPSTRRWLLVLLYVALVFAGVFMVGIGSMLVISRISRGMDNESMVYGLSWLIIVAVCVSFVLKYGLKRDAGVRRAEAWPVARLALGCVGASAMTLMTFWNIDTAVHLKMISVQQDANAHAASLTPGYVPDRENAALVYEKAFKELERLASVNKGKSHIWPFGPQHADLKFKGFGACDYPVNDPNVVAYVSQCQPFIALIRRASTLPNCSFDRTYKTTILTSLEFVQMRQCAQIMAMDARCKAADGKIGEALENVFVIHAMAAHLGSAEPSLLSGLMTCGLQEIGVETLQGILTTTTPTTADLANVPSEDAVVLEHAYYRSLVGEKALGLAGFSMMSEGHLPPEEAERIMPTSASSLYRVFFLPKEINSYTRYMNSVQAHAKESFKKSLASSRDLERDFANDSQRGMVTTMLAPAFSRIATSFARTQARQRLARLALAVAAYRAKNGHMPENLDALVPNFIAEIPNDPFTEMPLRFKKNGEAVVVYSVGESLKDHGGVASDDLSNSDIVFKIGVAGK